MMLDTMVVHAMVSFCSHQHVLSAVASKNHKLAEPREQRYNSQPFTRGDLHTWVVGNKQQGEIRQLAEQVRERTN